AERAVGGLAGVESVDVVLDADFEWTEEDLADEYRSRLLASRARRRDATTDRGGSDPAAPRELPARPEDRPGARAGSAASERSVLITRRRRGGRCSEQGVGPPPRTGRAPSGRPSGMCCWPCWPCWRWSE